MKYAIVMAAGKGTRMHSEVPKVLHQVCNQSMAELIIRNLKKANAERIVTVVGYGHEQVEKALEGKCEFALQEPQLGTGHAVMQAKQLEDLDGITLVVNGDCPCVQTETYEKLYQAAEHSDMVVLTTTLEDPKSYGRVVIENGKVKKIVEYKDCNEEEKKIRTINTGIYAFQNKKLFAGLKKLTNNNAQKEYYITDLVEIFLAQNDVVTVVEAEDANEVQGVNDAYELSLANAYIRNKINIALMKQGVTMIDPNTTYVGVDVEFGHDVVLYPNVYLYGNTKIGNHTTITPQSYLVNAEVGDYCTISSSEITDSVVKNHCQIGPYAHLRNGSVVDDYNRIGNFVEFKNTKFGVDSRCAHLTYLGDSDIGSKVNIGCGVVTVNYDGANKYHTVVKDGAFIGSNCNLIAPVTVGENAVAAAGSTITEDIPDTDMGIGRVRQVNKSGYGKFYLERNRAKKAAKK